MEGAGRFFAFSDLVGVFDGGVGVGLFAAGFVLVGLVVAGFVVATFVSFFCALAGFVGAF